MVTPEEREKLILDNQGLVGCIARKAMKIQYVKKSLGSYEDAFQVGMMALCKAIDKFDSTRIARSGPRKGKPIAIGSYVGKAIWNEIMRAALIESNIKLPSRYSGNKFPAHLLSKVELASAVRQLDYTIACETIPDRYCHSDSSEEASFNEIHKLINKHIMDLDNSRLEEIIKVWFEIGTTKDLLASMCKSFNVTKSRVQQIKSEALGKLKRTIVNEESWL